MPSKQPVRPNALNPRPTGWPVSCRAPAISYTCRCISISASGAMPMSTAQNELAAAADEAYIASCRAQGFYPAAYYTHNLHFLWTSYEMEGRYADSLKTAHRLVAISPVELARQYALGQFYFVTPMVTHVRFAHWDAALAEPKPGRHVENGQWRSGISAAALPSPTSNRFRRGQERARGAGRARSRPRTSRRWMRRFRRGKSSRSALRCSTAKSRLPPATPMQAVIAFQKAVADRTRHPLQRTALLARTGEPSAGRRAVAGAPAAGGRSRLSRQPQSLPPRRPRAIWAVARARSAGTRAEAAAAEARKLYAEAWASGRHQAHNVPVLNDAAHQETHRRRSASCSGSRFTRSWSCGPPSPFCRARHGRCSFVFYAVAGIAWIVPIGLAAALDAPRAPAPLRPSQRRGQVGLTATARLIS